VELASIEAGMQIDRRSSQSAKADSPRAEILAPGSNVKLESPSQWQKQRSEIVSTDEGIQIDRRAEQPEKANLPSLEIRQSHANLTDKIASQEQEHPS
jgi:hypothetical protein